MAESLGERMMVVCPFGRPERIEAVLGQWRAQTLPAAIVLVGSKPGPWCEQAEEAGALVEYADTTGDKRNLGLDVARSSGEEWVTFWDDDDYHGPGQLEMIDRLTTESDVVTAGIGFVRHAAGLYLYNSRAPAYFNGHSTAVRVSMAPYFPSRSFGEEEAWSRELRQSGARATLAPPWHLVYYRTGKDHAYPASDAVFMHVHGPAIRVGDVPDSFVDTPRAIEGKPTKPSLAEMIDA